MAAIVRYIALDDPSAARRMRQRLHEAVLPVAEHPYLYRPSERVAGCREIVAHPNYIIVYRVGAVAIDVLRVLHARRQFPD